MSDPNDPISAVLTQPLWAARASDRPLVAFAGNNVPLELIHASGCFPLQLPTAPGGDCARADRYLEARFDPMTRCALAQLLGGELDLAQLLVLPRSVDSWQRLYYYACELMRSFGERLPEPFLYDLQQLPTESSARYDLESTQLLAARLARLGRAAAESDLQASIALYDGLRRALGRMTELRRAQPCQLSGARALELYTASQRLAPETFTRALEAELERPAQPAPGVRTLLVGSAHDNPALHHMIARAGGQVVGDYHARGDLLFGPELRPEGPALPALSEHYHRHSWSVRSYPLQLGALLDLAARSGARVAVFFYYEQEEALTWDHPEQAAALAARGIPGLLLPREAYPPDPQLEARLRSFFKQHGAPHA